MRRCNAEGAKDGAGLFLSGLGRNSGSGQSDSEGRASSGVCRPPKANQDSELIRGFNQVLLDSDRILRVVSKRFAESSLVCIFLDSRD